MQDPLGASPLRTQPFLMVDFLQVLQLWNLKVQCWEVRSPALAEVSLDEGPMTGTLYSSIPKHLRAP